MKKILSLSFWTSAVCLWILTAAIVILRFEGGIGAVANLNNDFPWGIWISFDLTGIALSAGGFVLAACAHLLHIHKLENLLRPTVLTAFLGYSLASAAVLLDVGQPQRIWHPIVMWQHHSFMFEVAWCIMLYSTILVLEFGPVLLEKFNLRRAADIIRAFTLPIVLFGVLLSTLHQSSLGSLYLIVPEKLHAFWFSPLLPVFFLLSAVAGGICLVIAESLLVRKLLGIRMDPGTLSQMGRAAGIVLAVYGALRLGDFYRRGIFARFGSWEFENALILAELILGVLAPAVLLFLPRLRRNMKALFWISACVVGGVVLNRFNVTWFGLLRYSNFAYCPTWMETVSVLGLLCAGIAVFILAARYLPLYGDSLPRSADATSVQ